MNGVLMDRKMKSKIEFAEEYGSQCCIKFIDLDDVFWFDSKEDLQDFLNQVARERYYAKEVKKGYFTYVNEHGEKFKYHVTSNRGTLTLLSEEFIDNDNV